MKILVLGSLNLDRVYRVHNFVRPKETIHAQSFTCTCGGKGFNQSIALARAGSKVSFAGIAGADGDMLIEMLRKEGIDTTLMRQSSNVTGHTIIQVSDDGENCILVAAGANGETSKQYIHDVISRFSEGDWILLQNEIANVDYAIEYAHTCKLHVALNPSPFDDMISRCNLNYVDLLLINEVEGAGLAGATEPEQILSILQTQYPNLSVLLTLGECGAIFDDAHGIRDHVPSVPCVVKDTTAAGDTFTGYFLTSYFKDYDASRALAIAAAASSIAVSREGAARSIPYQSEVLTYMKQLSL